MNIKLVNIKYIYDTDLIGYNISFSTSENAYQDIRDMYVVSNIELTIQEIKDKVFKNLCKEDRNLQKMSIKDLEQCFYEANNNNAKYVGVKIKMQGFLKPEIIINAHANFDSKFAYYKKAYNKDLTLKTFNGIKIVGFTYGNSVGEIGDKLICNNK
ncbi:hypothetical protein [Clostridium felsineum]|uniref:hypothetical protein n=1 Tax=Clostridium felsineum TaxID=36839 RepID=UPI0009D53FB6|nr:hypothetical protein [Clostridium felsineum]URZ15319.1 hypothetical protein CLFE_013370 [Clostridium felsineum DSM 794]